MSTIRLVLAGLLAFVVATAGLPSAAGAQTGDETPEETGVATPPPNAEASEVRAAAATYTFGTQPLAAVMAAAADEADAASCLISDSGLAALMLAPTFPETGAGSSATPSPMTLSRYDINVGLHSLSDPSKYTRAFWHPGIGVWQFDSAGHWGKTAFERIDIAQIAPLAAEVMATRYCNARASGSTDAASRSAAWRPWVACRSNNACENIFQTIYVGPTSPLEVETDSSVGLVGGVVPSTCAPPGMAPRSCVRVDPARAEGYTGWRGTPGGSSNVAPLSHPFDVVKVDGNEWRLWKAADTGFGVDLAASKPLAANPRATSNPARPCERIGPIKWYVNGTLVDSVDRSGCVDPSPPPGFGRTAVSVGGTYEPLIGDYSGDGSDDIVWYRPGPGADYLWRSPVTNAGSIGLTINGTYRPLVGDFDGDGRDDIFWYAPGSAPDYVWTGRGGSPIAAPFTSHGGPSIQVRGTYDPVVADFDGDDVDDILWFAPDSPGNHLWRGGGGLSFDKTPMPLALDAVDAIGDFDGDGRTDLVGHRPGSAPDSFYYSTGAGFVRRDMRVNGSYNLTVGDFDGNGADDIHWYGTNVAADTIWFHERSRPAPGRQPAGAPADMVSGRVPLAIDRPGGSDLLWVAPGETVDQYWTFSGRSLSRSSSLKVTGNYRMYAGRWTGGGEGVLFYAPGSAPDAFWTR